MQHRPVHRSIARRGAVVAAFVATVATAAACVPPAPPGPTTTTTTTSAPSTVVPVTDAVLEWTVSDQTNNGSFAPGQVNYWSAGESDSTAATYVPTDGDATVLKKNASGTYVPIGSEPAVDWANRDKNGDGTVVTPFNATLLDQLVRYENGTGTVDTATGEAEIAWAGTFTINFYGQFVPVWMTDPVLTVEADGSGRLTATMGGFASDIGDPSTRVPLPDTPGVVVAEFADVYAAGDPTSGFVSPTSYLGRSVDTGAGAPQVAQTASNQAFWGAYPQSLVDFMFDTGLGSYWYTSGGLADPRKPSNPVDISWTAGS